MKRYYLTHFRGTMPSIRGHNFHPWLFVGTEEEYHWCIDQLQGQEDEFKITGWDKFDTLEEYKEAYPLTFKAYKANF